MISSVEKVDDYDYDKEGSEGDVAEEPVDFPEGGTRAWMTVIGSFVFQFSSYGYVNAFGVYNDYYVRIYLGEKYTSSQISWIGSAQIFLCLVMGLVSGRAFDAGYFYPIIICGTLLFSFSLFMLSLSRPEQYYQVFLAQGLANSIAIGMLYLPSLAIVSHYFRRRRALVLGISAAGSAVGGAIHPIMLNQWFHGPAGFHNGVRASAALNLGLMLISTPLMRPRLQPKTHRGSALINFRKFIREPAFTLTAFGMLFMIMGLYFPIFFVQLYSIKQGINPTLAFYSELTCTAKQLTILNGGSAVGRVVPTLGVKKYGVVNGVLACSISCTILIFCVLAVKNAVGIVLFASIYGIFSGAYIGLLGPMLALLAKSDSEIGERMGICFSVTGAYPKNITRQCRLSVSSAVWRPDR
ncbi:major facilitator superfamily domain-containing protein [Amanita rubescens]|nr:major facilitator superfamily domain-containing protein [Amanita rubescens]